MIGMKILQIIPHLYLGGAETMCETLTYELIKKGHEVIILSMFTIKTPITERMEKAKVDIRYLDKKGGFDFSMFSKISKIIIEEKPDVVHSHHAALKYIAPVAYKRKVKKIVHTVHSIAQKESGIFSRVLNKFFFKHYGVVPVALSELVKETVVETYKMQPKDVPYIYNGVDLSMCTPKKEYETHGAVKIFHIGSFYQPKNHIGLIRAFHKVWLKYPQCQLHLIGEGVEQKHIQKYVQDNGLEKSVFFLGAQSNVFDLIKDADVFTLPSNYEGIPMSLIEAMGTALPIVATGVGGIPDMIQNEVSGLIVEVDDDRIAEGLFRLVENEGLRKTLGQNALTEADRFSSKKMAEKYLEVYKN